MEGMQPVQEALFANLPAIVEANFERALERYRSLCAGNRRPFLASNAQQSWTGPAVQPGRESPLQHGSDTGVDTSNTRYYSDMSDLNGAMEQDIGSWLHLPGPPQDGAELEDSSWEMEDHDWTISNDLFLPRVA